MTKCTSRSVTCFGTFGLLATTAGLWPGVVQAHDWSWQPQDDVWYDDTHPSYDENRPVWGVLVSPKDVRPVRRSGRQERAYLIPQARLRDGTLYPTDQYLRGQTNHPSVASPNH